MKQNSSSRRVDEQAREVISNILLFDIADPRLQLVTITGCEVSFDRSVCNVFYSTEPKRYDQVQHAFEKAAGRIRSLMARQLSWRVAPQLRFLLDKSVDEAQRIGRALASDAERNAQSAQRVQADGDAQADARFEYASTDAAPTSSSAVSSNTEEGSEL